MSEVTLYCGDCLEVMRGMADNSVSAVVTDPPFGIGFKYDSHDDNPDDYEAFMKAFVAEAQRLVGDGAMFVWQAMLNANKWHRWFPSEFRLFAACKGFVQYRPTPIQYSWDPVVFWGKPPINPSVYNKDFHIQNLAPFGAGRPKINHPCPRPLEQVAYVICLASLVGDTVLDPFMGSGTTGVACVNTNRNFIGIEKDAGYYAIAEKRIEEAQSKARQLAFSA